MKNVLNHDVPCERFFEEITRIPHGSCNEKALSDWIVAFAEERGLRAVQDKMWNVVVYKPAQNGGEKSAPVLMQAHIDMVCAKVINSGHDFEKDPLELYIEDGWLHARGTTLGADDGMGAAYMLAVLDSKTIKHPPLECVFTTREEIGLEGASALDLSLISARRMLNLDDGTGTTTASAGGLRLKLALPAEFGDCDMRAYAVSVGGLLGGHSGHHAPSERGNAIKAVGSILNAIDDGSLRIASVDGGEKTNAIPRDCRAVFFSALPDAEVRSRFEAAAAIIKTDLADTDPNVSVTLDPADAKRAMTRECSAKILDMLCIIPTDMRHMNKRLGIPDSSQNVAIASTDEKSFVLSASLRGARDSRVDEMEREFRVYARLFGAEFESGARYPAWPFNDGSEMRRMLVETFKARTGKDIKFRAAHGGLECGIFSALPGMDITTFGAVMENGHTPDERLNLASFRENYLVIEDMLAKL